MNTRPATLSKPRLQNTYEADEALRSYLTRALPAEVLAEIEPGLRSLGARAAAELAACADEAEAQPPKHVPFDAWGARVDRLETSPGWARIRAAVAEEGLVAIPYERRHGALSRVHQAARLLLYHPSSATFTCPVGMTDGAARVIDRYASPELRARALPRLTARDPSQLWTSGQWMTEYSGGSDVANGDTVAKPDGEGAYRLFGHKNFVSALDGDTAVVLARMEGAPAGAKGLSLFFAELKDPSGAFRGLTIDRLKDKLGTRAVPTAEVTLEGLPAVLLGEPGGGVRRIATMLNITRLHNACGAIGYLRRGLMLARDYAPRRSAFGRKLVDWPLHVEVLADLQVEFEGAMHLTFRVAELAGRDENGDAGDDERALRRVLTAIAKALTAKIAVAGCSEVLECFGGVGYLEDTGLPRLLRDAQVLPIWEGTTNVLGLETLRALGSKGAAAALFEDTTRLLQEAKSEFPAEADKLLKTAGALAPQLAPNRDPEDLQASARALMLTMGRLYTGGLLLRHASWSKRSHEPGSDARAAAAVRWCRRIPAAPMIDPEHRRQSRALAVGADVRDSSREGDIES
ncbi:MAG: acyl-CoA dehydrogenase family protein [Polyangiaceae bacterium]